MNNCLLDRIVAPGGLQTYLQPIYMFVDGSVRVHSMEVLTRGPAGTNLARAEVLFEYIRRKREEPLVDRLCAAHGLEAIGRIEDNFRVNINVHASTLQRDPDFTAFLAQRAQAVGVDPRRITLEIIEHVSTWTGTALRDTLCAARAHGLEVAVDDIGLGHSNYRMLLECRPNYFKIDRYLVQGVRDDPYRREILRSIAALAAGVDAHAVAEGIESEGDLLAVRDLGVTMVQGYYLGRPRPVGNVRPGSPANDALALAG